MTNIQNEIKENINKLNNLQLELTKNLIKKEIEIEITKYIINNNLVGFNDNTLKENDNKYLINDFIPQIIKDYKYFYNIKYNFFYDNISQNVNVNIISFKEI